MDLRRRQRFEELDRLEAGVYVLVGGSAHEPSAAGHIRQWTASELKRSPLVGSSRTRCPAEWPGGVEDRRRPPRSSSPPPAKVRSTATGAPYRDRTQGFPSSE